MAEIRAATQPEKPDVFEISKAEDHTTIPVLDAGTVEPTTDVDESRKDSHLVFAYLRKKRPLPSAARSRWIVWVTARNQG